MIMAMPGSARRTVREGCNADAELLLTIQRSASLAALGHIFPAEKYPFPNDAVRECWEERLMSRHTLVFVAEEDGAPVGVAATSLGRLEGFFVRPERWGTGVAALLHERAL